MKKFNKLVLIFVMFIVSFCFASCVEASGKNFNFSFVPSSVSREVNNTFNIFDLNFVTSLPDTLDLSTYNGVTITPENKDIVSVIPNTNNVKTLSVGSTRVNVVINYNSQNIPAYFDLTITENTEEPKENPNSEDNKQDEEVYSVIGLTYTLELEVFEDGVDYFISIKKDGEWYNGYEIKVLEEYEEVAWVESRILHSVTISTITLSPIKIEIKDGDNIDTITLRID